jgi:hypothetical protein
MIAPRRIKRLITSVDQTDTKTITCQCRCQGRSGDPRTDNGNINLLPAVHQTPLTFTTRLPQCADDSLPQNTFGTQK